MDTRRTLAQHRAETTPGVAASSRYGHERREVCVKGATMRTRRANDGTTRTVNGLGASTKWTLGGDEFKEEVGLGEKVSRC